jgi:hypothetical protein
MEEKSLITANFVLESSHCHKSCGNKAIIQLIFNKPLSIVQVFFDQTIKNLLCDGQTVELYLEQSSSTKSKCIPVDHHHHCNEKSPANRQQQKSSPQSSDSCYLQFIS